MEETSNSSYRDGPNTCISLLMMVVMVVLSLQKELLLEPKLVYFRSQQMS